MSIRLVVLAGPIGAGKSSVAELLARRVARAGRPAAVVDLDEIAFMQRGRIELPEFWRRAGTAHLAAVRGWFAAGTDTVVAHGPFFETDIYDELLEASPPGSSALHVLLRVSYRRAVERVTADPDRGPDALSRDLDFLRSTHEAFHALGHNVPAVDVEVDTEDQLPDAIADDLAQVVLA